MKPNDNMFYFDEMYEEITHEYDNCIVLYMDQSSDNTAVAIINNQDEIDVIEFEFARTSNEECYIANETLIKCINMPLWIQTLKKSSKKSDTIE